MQNMTGMDVVVCGGGPAGIGAALASARAGAKTLLIERHAFCGGVGAWGLGMPINQMRPDNRPRGAVHELVIQSLLKYGDDAARVVGHAVVCNVSRLHVPLPLPRGGRDRRKQPRAGCGCGHEARIDADRREVVVDTTGDADVAFYSGTGTVKGRDADGFLSPMTLLLMITNVDVDAARELGWERSGAVRPLRQRLAASARHHRGRHGTQKLIATAIIGAGAGHVQSRRRSRDRQPQDQGAELVP